MAMAGPPPLGLMFHGSLTGKTWQQQKMPVSRTYTSIGAYTHAQHTHLCTQNAHAAYLQVHTHSPSRMCVNTGSPASSTMERRGAATDCHMLLTRDAPSLPQPPSQGSTHPEPGAASVTPSHTHRIIKVVTVNGTTLC